jgi:hypothetical protein
MRRYVLIAALVRITLGALGGVGIALLGHPVRPLAGSAA